ncbi:MAG: hypothetical protein HUJ91_05070 [Bacteroidales bacterium]|nr:hypothetical protein [Bacteroidales bacterium]
MKKVILSAASLIMAAMVAVSCGMLSGNGGLTSTNQASTNGTTAGKAIKSLLASYLTDGKIDTGNASNLIQLASLASSLQSLKGTTEKSADYSNFLTGLISGSKETVNKSNGASVMNALSSIANGGMDLSSIFGLASKAAASQAASSTAQSAEVGAMANSVSAILGMLK